MAVGNQYERLTPAETLIPFVGIFHLHGLYKNELPGINNDLWKYIGIMVCGLLEFVATTSAFGYGIQKESVIDGLLLYGLFRVIGGIALNDSENKRMDRK